MLAVAATEDVIPRLLARLDEIGVVSVDTIAPSRARRVLVISLLDELSSERVAVALRAEGWLAVTRPASGAALAAWKRDTEPVSVAGRVSLSLAWSEHERANHPGMVELGPGGFGSGRHPTTRLIIELLAERLVGGERVLDVGCGSGVLALAAIALGASSAVGVDLKPEAVEATRRNADLNGFGHRVEAGSAPLDALDRRFDVVVANIARAGIVSLAPHLVASLAPGGWMVLSGITPAQCEPVVDYLRPLQEFERRSVDGWSALVLSDPRTQSSE